MENKLYFAYGSNLDVQQMARRCPLARKMGRATLKDYALKFDGPATVVPAHGQKVLGGLWIVTPSDLKALDRYEGYPTLYARQWVKVHLEPKGWTWALVYIMPLSKTPEFPYPGYIETIKQGYRDFGWPEAELQKALDQHPHPKTPASKFESALDEPEMDSYCFGYRQGWKSAFGERATLKEVLHSLLVDASKQYTDRQAAVLGCRDGYQDGSDDLRKFKEGCA